MKIELDSRPSPAGRRAALVAMPETVISGPATRGWWPRLAFPIYSTARARTRAKVAMRASGPAMRASGTACGPGGEDQTRLPTVASGPLTARHSGISALFLTLPAFAPADS